MKNYNIVITLFPSKNFKWMLQKDQYVFFRFVCYSFLSLVSRQEEYT